MEWKNIKRIFSSSYKDLSQKEQRMAGRVICVVVGIIAFCLAAGYLTSLRVGQKGFLTILWDINFLYFLLMVYTGFLLFNLVYKKRILRIFKITSFLIFCAGLVVFGFKAGSFILQTSGLLIFLALAAQFIYSIFHSAKDVLTEKDEIKLKEEFNQK